jgi:hypothetical protein
LAGNLTIAQCHTDGDYPCKTDYFWTDNFAGFPYGRNRTGL